jgi:ribosomal protein L37AE/L43A
MTNNMVKQQWALQEAYVLRCPQCKKKLHTDKVDWNRWFCSGHKCKNNTAYTSIGKPIKVEIDE